MAEADRLTIANGVPGITLMENAGRAVADCASRHPARHVLVVAGPGNNGGDGFVAARLLAERGAQVEVLLLGDRAARKGDAAIAASRWKGQTTTKQTEAFAGAELIIDALFGAGLARPIEGEAATIVEAINAAGVPVIAVDVPSGIHGDSGVALGPAV
ncbi:MAG: NAD(P)H-hydrate epimerase, partial [Pseudolabrys sp.]|nr:NAD(P)H-hydrate epimerase [Pseudolabrys sp.]